MESNPVWNKDFDIIKELMLKIIETLSVLRQYFYKNNSNVYELELLLFFFLSFLPIFLF